MAITWADARTKVRGDLWRPGTVGVSDDVCDRALHASILELESARKWLWLENIKRSVALDEAKSRLQVPSDLSTIQAVSYVSPAGVQEYPLTRVDIAALRPDAVNGASPGIPEFYAFSPDEIYLDREAPIGAVFELVYTARTNPDLATAVADGDTNATLQREQSAVIANACHYVALGYLKNEAEAARKRTIYERHLERLEGVEDEARGDTYGGSIVPDTHFDQLAGRL